MDALIADAQKVFGKGFVKNLTSRGMAWEESGRERSVVSDSNGNEYIDCYCSSGTYNLGRKNPAIAHELKQAIRETDQGNFVMISREKALLSEKLARFTPHTLDCFLFTVVRGEAVDAACKLARGYTGRSELITVDGASYGQTGFAMSLSERSDKNNFDPLIPDIQTIPFNDIDAAGRTITKKTAAVILEPVQAENNCRIADKDYLIALRTFCDKTGTLLIFDESQTGFGRTGEKFASDYFGVLPHIMIIGEALSGGMFPIGALVFTASAKSFFDEHPLIHLLTFGGHDVGCRVAAAALKEYDQIKPWKNAHKQGNVLKDRLKEMAGSNSKLKSVQGIGLMLSLEFEGVEEAEGFCRSAIQQGVLVKRGEVAKHSVIIRPPLTINDQDLNKIVTGIEKALSV
ncbi:MAG: aspartate aminotransferase family protein [Spirochaetota bacterium]